MENYNVLKNRLEKMYEHMVPVAPTLLVLLFFI